MLTSTYFLGNAPALEISVFDDGHPNHIIYYLDTSTGFTSPTWNGYPTQMINTATYPAANWLLSSNIPYDTNLHQDLNGDGVPLLMAYALNLNPSDNLTGKLPKTGLTNDSAHLRFYGDSSGVTYDVETSKDLITWVPTVVTEPDTEGIRSASISREGGCGFLRLVVEEE